MQIQHEITTGLQSGILKTFSYVRILSCKGLLCQCLQTQCITRVIKCNNVVDIDRNAAGKLSRWKEVLCQMNAGDIAMIRSLLLQFLIRLSNMVMPG